MVFTVKPGFAIRRMSAVAVGTGDWQVVFFSPIFRTVLLKKTVHKLQILAALRAARYASVFKGSWLSIALGLAMMGLDVRKNLKPTQL